MEAALTFLEENPGTRPASPGAKGQSKPETRRTPWSAAGRNKPAPCARRKPPKSGGTTRAERDSNRGRFEPKASDARKHWRKLLLAKAGTGGSRGNRRSSQLSNGLRPIGPRSGEFGAIAGWEWTRTSKAKAMQATREQCKQSRTNAADVDGGAIFEKSMRGVRQDSPAGSRPGTGTTTLGSRVQCEGSTISGSERFQRPAFGWGLGKRPPAQERAKPDHMSRMSFIQNEGQEGS